MSSYTKKPKAWIKIIAMAVVCAFTINNIAWAYPDFGRKPSDHTLQVPSMFKPILDVAGWKYDTQVRVELACILSMALKDEMVPFQDINSELDKWLSAVPAVKRKRLLNVLSNPQKEDEKTVLDLEIFTGPKKGKKFRIKSTCENIEDIQNNENKIKIEELPEDVEVRPEPHVEIRPNAKFKIKPSECRRILEKLYEEETVDLKDVRVVIDRFPITEPFVEGVDTVSYYEKDADLRSSKRGNDVPLDITINTRAFEYGKQGLADLEEALRNAIRDHQEGKDARSVPRYTMRRDRSKRAIEPRSGDVSEWQGLQRSRIWGMNFAHWEHGRETRFLERHQASHNKDFIEWQAKGFFERLIHEKDEGEIVVAELSAGSCKHADLWLAKFKEIQDQHNENAEVKVDLFERLIFVIADVSRERLEAAINEKDTPCLARNRVKIKLAEVDLAKIDEQWDSVFDRDKKVDLSNASLVMINYAYNIMPVGLISKRNGRFYERKARAYLAPELDQAFIHKHADEFGPLEVFDVDDLIDFIANKDRYEKGIQNLSLEVVQELWNGIRLEYQSLIDPSVPSHTKEYLEAVGLDNVTTPISTTFDESVAAILDRWLFKKKGSLEILDTVMREPVEFKRRFWQLRRYGLSLASWINYLYFRYARLDEAHKDRKIDAEASSISKIIGKKGKFKATFLSFEWHPEEKEVAEIKIPVVDKLKEILGEDLRGKKILELGVGTRADHIVALTKAGAQVTAIDIKSSILEARRRILKEKGIDNPDLRQMDFNKPFIFENEEFDAIVFRNILDFVPDDGKKRTKEPAGAREAVSGSDKLSGLDEIRERAIAHAIARKEFFKECKRVLRSGGLVVAEDIADPEYEAADHKLGELMAEFFEISDIGKAATAAGFQIMERNRSFEDLMLVLTKGGSDQDPFPWIADGTEVTVGQVAAVFNHKYLLRRIFMGGPIAQPGFFGLCGRYDSYLSPFLKEADTVDFRSEVEGMISSGGKYSLVFKPNEGALGDGVFFIGVMPDGNIRVVSSLLGRLKKDMEEAFRGDRGVRLDVDEKHDVIRVTIKPKHTDAVAAVTKIKDLVVTVKDEGMMETVMPVVRYGQRAYETRHTFIGNLSEEDCELTHTGYKTHSGLDLSNWFARIGSSAEFSNKTGRTNAIRREWLDMYDPLFEIFNIKEKDRGSFIEYVDDIVRQQFAYGVRRLKEAGINIDIEVKGQFDLMWLPPVKGEFPRPVLIESALWVQADLYGNREDVVIKRAQKDASQIGKRAIATRPFEINGRKYVSVIDAEDRNKVLKERLELFEEDLEEAKRILREFMKRKPDCRGTLEMFLGLLEHSPPKLYSFDHLVKDLFGFTSLREKSIALHGDLIDNPVALFHEIGEYLNKTYVIEIELINGDKDISIRMPDARTRAPVRVRLSTHVRKWLIGKGEKWPKTWKKDPHYLLRALQLEFFGRGVSTGKDQEDLELTRFIRDRQKESAGHYDISGPFIAEGIKYYAKEVNDPNEMTKVLDKWFEQEGKHYFNRDQWNGAINRAKEAGLPISMSILETIKGDLLGVALDGKGRFPFKEDARKVWQGDYMEVSERYRGGRMGRVLLAKRLEKVLADLEEEYSYELPNGEVVYEVPPERISERIFIVHPAEDEEYAHKQGGKRAKNFFYGIGFKDCPITWEADTEDAQKDLWLSISETRARELIEGVRQQMKEPEKVEYQQAGLFDFMGPEASETMPQTSDKKDEDLISKTELVKREHHRSIIELLSLTFSKYDPAKTESDFISMFFEDLKNVAENAQFEVFRELFDYLLIMNDAEKELLKKILVDESHVRSHFDQKAQQEEKEKAIENYLSRLKEALNGWVIDELVGIERAIMEDKEVESFLSDIRLMFRDVSKMSGSHDPTLLAGRYKMEKKLGTGAYSVVYKAKDTKTGQDVTVRVLRYSSKKDLQRKLPSFLKGYCVMKHLGEVGGVVKGVDIGRWGRDNGRGDFFMVTKFVSGRSMDALIKSGRRFAPDEAVALAKGILQIIEKVQSKRIVHTDMKPANILLPEKGGKFDFASLVFLVDFDLALRLPEGGEVRINDVRGTPDYLPWEAFPLFEDGRYNEKTDVYGLGIILYNALTDRVPFRYEGGNIAEYFKAKSQVEPADIRDVAKREGIDVPDALADFIMKCIRKDPEDRFKSVGEAIKHLDEEVLPSFQGGKRAKVTSTPAKTPLDEELLRLTKEALKEEDPSAFSGKMDEINDYVFQKTTGHEAMTKDNDWEAAVRGVFGPVISKVAVTPKQALKGINAKTGKKLAWFIKLPMTLDELKAAIEGRTERTLMVFSDEDGNKYLYVEKGESESTRVRFASLCETDGHSHSTGSHVDASRDDREGLDLDEKKAIFILMHNGASFEMSLSRKGYTEFIIVDEKDVENELREIGIIGPEGKKTSQMGKRAQVETINVDVETETLKADVKDSKGVTHVIPLDLKGALSIASLRSYYEGMPGIMDGHREMILTVLSRLEKSPPRLYTYDHLIEDLYGIASPNHNLIALHKDLYTHPVALFHEISEYMMKLGMLDLKLEEDILTVFVNGSAVTVNVEQAMEELRGESELWAYWDGTVLGAVSGKHYLLRVLQRAVFRERDRELTEKIQAGQKKTATRDKKKSRRDSARIKAFDASSPAAKQRSPMDTTTMEGLFRSGLMMMGGKFLFNAKPDLKINADGSIAMNPEATVRGRYLIPIPEDLSWEEVENIQDMFYHIEELKKRAEKAETEPKYRDLLLKQAEELRKEVNSRLKNVGIDFELRDEASDTSVRLSPAIAEIAERRTAEVVAGENAEKLKNIVKRIKLEERTTVYDKSGKVLNPEVYFSVVLDQGGVINDRRDAEGGRTQLSFNSETGMLEVLSEDAHEYLKKAVDQYNDERRGKTKGSSGAVTVWLENKTEWMPDWVREFLVAPVVEEAWYRMILPGLLYIFGLIGLGIYAGVSGIPAEQFTVVSLLVLFYVVQTISMIKFIYDHYESRQLPAVIVSVINIAIFPFLPMIAGSLFVLAIPMAIHALLNIIFWRQDLDTLYETVFREEREVVKVKKVSEEKITAETILENKKTREEISLKVLRSERSAGKEVAEETTKDDLNNPGVWGGGLKEEFYMHVPGHFRFVVGHPELENVPFYVFDGADKGIFNFVSTPTKDDPDAPELIAVDKNMAKMANVLVLTAAEYLERKGVFKIEFRGRVARWLDKIGLFRFSRWSGLIRGRITIRDAEGEVISTLPVRGSELLIALKNPESPHCLLSAWYKARHEDNSSILENIKVVSASLKKRDTKTLKKTAAKTLSGREREWPTHRDRCRGSGFEAAVDIVLVASPEFIGAAIDQVKNEGYGSSRKTLIESIGRSLKKNRSWRITPAQLEALINTLEQVRGLFPSKSNKFYRMASPYLDAITAALVNNPDLIDRTIDILSKERDQGMVTLYIRVIGDALKENKNKKITREQFLVLISALGRVADRYDPEKKETPLAPFAESIAAALANDHGLIDVAMDTIEKGHYEHGDRSITLEVPLEHFVGSRIVSSIWKAMTDDNTIKLNAHQLDILLDMDRGSEFFAFASGRALANSPEHFGKLVERMKPDMSGQDRGFFRKAIMEALKGGASIMGPCLEELRGIQIPSHKEFAILNAIRKAITEDPSLLDVLISELRSINDTGLVRIVNSNVIAVCLSSDIRSEMWPKVVEGVDMLYPALAEYKEWLVANRNLLGGRIIGMILGEGLPPAFICTEGNDVMLQEKIKLIEKLGPETPREVTAYILQQFDDVEHSKKLEFIRGLNNVLHKRVMGAEDGLDAWQIFLEHYVPDFGFLASGPMIIIHRCLFSGVPLDDPNLKKYSLGDLNITSTGEEGIRQLHRVISPIRAELNEKKDIDEKHLGNPVVSALVGQITGFSTAQWGHGSHHRHVDLETFVRYFHGHEKSMSPLSSRLEETEGSFEVRRKGAIDFTGDERSAFKKFNGLIRQALTLSDEKDPLEQLRAKAMGEINRELFDMESRVELIDNERGKAAVRKQIGRHREMIGRLEKVSSPVEIAVEIERAVNLKKVNQSLQELIIACLLYETFRQYPQLKEEIAAILNEGLSINFIDKIIEIKRTFWKEHILSGVDKKDSKKILSIFKITAFENARARQEELMETSRVEAFITKGILGEMAGDIGDACYTCVINLMKCPSMVGAVIFTRGEGMEKKFIGSMLLLKNSINGEKTWIMRAINPGQGFIAEYSPEDFVKGTLEYIATLAKKEGVRFIVAPTESIGALSNRYTVLPEIRKIATGEPVVLDKNENLNGYQLRRACKVMWINENAAGESKEYDEKIAEVEPITKGHHLIITRENLESVVEEPLLEACQALFDKGIYTYMSSANKYNLPKRWFRLRQWFNTLRGERKVKYEGFAYISIKYDPMTDENKEIIDGIIEGGGEHDGVFFTKFEGDAPYRKPSITVWIPLKRNSTVKEISAKAMGIADLFKSQKMKSKSSVFTEQDRHHMTELIQFAKEKIQSGELDKNVPVVARIVDGDGNVVVTVARRKYDSSSKYGVNARHAEVEAIRQAEALDEPFTDWANATLYVNLAPCHNCTKTLAEFYGVGKVVYVWPDENFPPKEQTRNEAMFRENNGVMVKCDDDSILREMRDIFGTHKYDWAKATTVYDVCDEMLDVEQALTEEYRRKHQELFGEDIQVCVFEADLWDEYGQKDDIEGVMFRHIEYIKQNLNPRKDHVLLIVGNDENCRKAREKIVGEGIYEEKNVVIVEKSDEIKIGPASLGSKLDMWYSPFLHAPILEELGKVGVPFGILAVLNWLNAGMPMLNTAIFTGVLSIFGIVFTLAHVINRRGPPGWKTDILTYTAPFTAAVAGAAISLIFISQPWIAIPASMAAHLFINLIVALIRKLLKVSLEYATGRRWTDEQTAKIPEAIKVLHDAGVDLSAAAIQKDTSKKTTQIISRIIGRRGTTGCSLLQKARTVYKGKGGWDGALKVAGLDFQQIKNPHPLYWTEEQLAKIPEAIRALHDAGIDVSLEAISKDTSEKTTQIISRMIGRSGITGTALYVKARKVYKDKGGWNEVLKAAELDPEQIRKVNPWTKEDIAEIPKVIKALHDAGVDLSSGAIQKDTSGKTTQIIFRIIGRRGATGRALYAKALAAYKDKGGWNGALKAAGLDPQQIKKPFPLKWTEEQLAKIPEAIRALHDAGVDLSSVGITNDTSEKTTQIISRIIGRNVRGGTFYAKACKVYKEQGSWSGALKAAGLDPQQIKRFTFWTKEQIARIPEAIKALHDAGIDVSVKAIGKDASEKTTQIVSRMVGRSGTTGRSLYQKAQTVYKDKGGWYGALKAAGLDFKERMINAGFGNTCYWRGKRFPSRLERNTAMVLSHFGLIEDVVKGNTWQVDMGGKRIDFHFKFNGHSIYIEAHPENDPWTGENMPLYWSRRRLLLNKSKKGVSQLYIVTSVEHLYSILRVNFGVKVTNKYIRAISEEIKRADKETALREKEEVADADLEGKIIQLYPDRKVGVASLGSKLDMWYSPFLHAPILEELGKVGVPFGLLAILNWLNPGMLIWNQCMFAWALISLAGLFVFGHLKEPRAPPAISKLFNRVSAEYIKKKASESEGKAKDWHEIAISEVAGFAGIPPTEINNIAKVYEEDIEPRPIFTSRTAQDNPWEVLRYFLKGESHLLNKLEKTPPVIVKWGDRYLISKGDNMCIAAWFMGIKSIRAKVIEITDQEEIKAFDDLIAMEEKEGETASFIYRTISFQNWSDQLAGAMTSGPFYVRWKLHILAAPVIAAFTGIAISMIYMQQPALAIGLSILAHLAVNIIVWLIKKEGQRGYASLSEDEKKARALDREMTRILAEKSNLQPTPEEELKLMMDFVANPDRVRQYMMFGCKGGKPGFLTLELQEVAGLAYLKVKIRESLSQKFRVIGRIKITEGTKNFIFNKDWLDDWKTDPDRLLQVFLYQTYGERRAVKEKRKDPHKRPADAERVIERAKSGTTTYLMVEPGGSNETIMLKKGRKGTTTFRRVIEEKAEEDLEYEPILYEVEKGEFNEFKERVRELLEGLPEEVRRFYEENGNFEKYADYTLFEDYKTMEVHGVDNTYKRERDGKWVKLYSTIPEWIQRYLVLVHRMMTTRAEEKDEAFDELRRNYKKFIIMMLGRLYRFNRETGKYEKMNENEPHRISEIKPEEVEIVWDSYMKEKYGRIYIVIKYRGEEYLLYRSKSHDGWKRMEAVTAGGKAITGTDVKHIRTIWYAKPLIESLNNASPELGEWLDKEMEKREGKIIVNHNDDRLVMEFLRLGLLVDLEGRVMLERNGKLSQDKYEVDGRRYGAWRYRASEQISADRAARERIEEEGDDVAPQIGKLAKVVDVDMDKKIATVKDSKGTIHQVRLTPYGTGFLKRLNAQLKAMKDLDKFDKNGMRHLIGYFEESSTGHFEKSGAVFCTFDEAVEDLFGFAVADKKVAAIHRYLAEDPGALMHELMEYLVKSNEIELRYKGAVARFLKRVGLYGLVDRLLGWTGITSGTVIIKSLYGREEGRPKWPVKIRGEALSIALKDTKDPHYLIRAVQRQIFGERDRELTETIKVYQRAAEEGILDGYPLSKINGYEIFGVDTKREIAEVLREYTGVGFLARQKKVYSPFGDKSPSIDFCEAISREMKDLGKNLLKKHKKDIRVLVVGSGTGIDAMTAAHQARLNGFENVHIDAIDIDPNAVDNTLYNSMLAGAEYAKAIQPKLVEEGREFEGLADSYDLILFNAPGAFDVSSMDERTKRVWGEDRSRIMDLEIFKNIIEKASKRLSPDGVALIGNLYDLINGREKIFPRNMNVIPVDTRGGTLPEDARWRAIFRIEPSMEKGSKPEEFPHIRLKGFLGQKAIEGIRKLNRGKKPRMIVAAGTRGNIKNTLRQVLSTVPDDEYVIVQIHMVFPDRDVYRIVVDKAAKVREDIELLCLREIVINSRYDFVMDFAVYPESKSVFLHGISAGKSEKSKSYKLLRGKGIVSEIFGRWAEELKSKCPDWLISANIIESEGRLRHLFNKHFRMYEGGMLAHPEYLERFKEIATLDEKVVVGEISDPEAPIEEREEISVAHEVREAFREKHIEAVDEEKEARKIMQKIDDMGSSNKKLRRTIRGYLSEAAKRSSAELPPVDVVIDLSLFSREDLETNIETLAQLILLCSKTENINFVFEKRPKMLKGKKLEGSLEDAIEKAPDADEVIRVLRAKLKSKAILYEGDDRKISKLINERVKSTRSSAKKGQEPIEIPIISKAFLEWASDNDVELTPNQYPVAMEELTLNEQDIVPLRNMEAALSIGLSKALLVMTRRKIRQEKESEAEKAPGFDRMKPEEREALIRNMVDSELGRLIENDKKLQKILKDITELYVLFEKKVPITVRTKTLVNMTFPDSTVRMNLAITMSLPPVTRMAIDKLQHFHECIQLALQMA
ncbi:protein kinase [Candidatus Omnitrophota bacterium]